MACEGDEVREGCGVDRAAAHWRQRRRPAESEHAGDVDDRASLALEHAGHGGASQHRWGEHLHVDEFAGLADGQFGERHVVRDPGVVDQQVKRL